MSDREPLATYGYRGRTVRVFVETRTGQRRVCVQWKGIPGWKSWPDSPAHRRLAKQFGKGVFEGWDRVTAGAGPTVEVLFTQYAEAQFPRLRPRSQTLYRDAWRKFEVFAGATTLAEDVTPVMLAELRRECEHAGLAVNTIRQVIRAVKTVYAWAERLEVIARNRLHLFRFEVGKDEKPTPPPEYSTEEAVRLLAALDPRAATQWRPWAALAITLSQGARQNAVLHLQESDIAEGRIHWRAEWDKTGRAWHQPVVGLTGQAVAVAQDWKRRLGLEGDWLFPSGRRGRRGAVYTAQSLWVALRAAERRAGVPHRPWRAGHSLRRNVSGDVAEATGNPMTGLHAIGDTDPRRATEYVQKRDSRVDDALASRGKALQNRYAVLRPEEKPRGVVSEVVATEGVRGRVASAPRRNRTFNLLPIETGKTGQVGAISPVDNEGTGTEGPEETTEAAPATATKPLRVDR